MWIRRIRLDQRSVSVGPLELQILDDRNQAGAVAFTMQRLLSRTYAPSMKISQLVAAFGAASMAILGLGVGPAQAEATTSPAAKLSKHCSIPPPWSSKRWESFRSQGVSHKGYRTKGVSAQSVSIYYRDWARWRGYKVLTWGGGDTYTGKKAGSGWGITAHSKKCGYLEVNVGQTRKGPSYSEICTGKSRAVLTLCAANKKTGAGGQS